MYKYVINPQVNKALFYKQCERLEKKMSGIVKKRFTKKPLLEDVDGALIQIYEHPRGEIDVYNDEQLDELYLRSEFDLRPYGVLLK